MTLDDKLALVALFGDIDPRLFRDWFESHPGTWQQHVDALIERLHREGTRRARRSPVSLYE